MKPVQLAITAVALLGMASAAPTAPAAQTCDATGVCWSETSAGGIVYRVSIPTAKAAPFDILFQIVAPKATGWAAIAWGGAMAANPLTLGWANGSSTVVSSRWATGHVLPNAYAGATYTVLSGSTTNATHWTLSALCTGCSQWTGGSLDPTSATAGVAYALSASAPTDPTNNASRIAIHSQQGKFTLDLKTAQTDKFASYVQTLQGTKPSS